MMMTRHFTRWALPVAFLVLQTAAATTAAVAQEECFGETATIVATEGDDSIEGTPGHDVIIAGEGNDIIYGRDGNDFICGGPGDDSLQGEAGDDRIDGGEGSESE